MRWHLEGKVWRVCLSTGTLLAVSTSSTYAESYNSWVMLQFPDDIQKEGTPTQVKLNQDLPDSLVMLELPEVIQEQVTDEQITNDQIQLNQKLPENILAQEENRKGNTNEERFLPNSPRSKPLSPEDDEEIIEEPKGEQDAQRCTEINSSNNPDASFTVNKIEVTGSTIFNQEQFNPLIQPLEGKSVSCTTLQEVANAITKLYTDRGYITSKAVLSQKPVSDGVATISVIEGVVSNVNIQGTTRLTNYVRSRLALGLSKPVSAVKLENQLRLLRQDPLFSYIEASLRKGQDDEPGKNTLVVRVIEADSFQATLSADNYSPPSVGSERFGINTTYNLTGLGDQLTASYYFTPRGGSNVYDVSYQVPVNTMNGAVTLRTSINNNKVIQEPFKVFDIYGESQLYEISYRQPLVRSPRQEFALSLGFTMQDGQTFTFAGPTPFGYGPDDQGNSRTRVIKFGQDYLLRDGGGIWALRSLFNFGVDVFDPTINSHPIPDGRFFSWLGQIQRVQRLGNDNILISQAQVQLSPNSLLPSQQFVIGGGQSVRGYRQNSRAGDNGVRFVLENQLTVSKDTSGKPVFKVAPFFDLGYVWNISDNPNRLQSQNFLAGTGVGVLWQVVPNLNLRLDYSLPLINLNDRGVNAQDDGFYFNMAYKL